jgi:hypothetical protein
MNKLTLNRSVRENATESEKAEGADVIPPVDPAAEAAAEATATVPPDEAAARRMSEPACIPFHPASLNTLIQRMLPSARVTRHSSLNSPLETLSANFAMTPIRSSA